MTVGERRPGRRGKRRRMLLVVLVTGVIVACAATLRLFVWPAQGTPPRVSAIVMLSGSGDRFDAAVNLARQHRASYLVISGGTPDTGADSSSCAPRISGVRVICFNPDPATTQGEAEFAGRLAREFHWTSVTLVTSTTQDSRARLRMERCFPGPVYVVAASLPLSAWPQQIAYEWGALAKALVLQPSC